MKTVTDLKVTQIRIFPVDVVPLSLITTKTCIDKIRDTLSIGEVEVRPFIEGNIIIFRRGELRKDTRVIVVSKIEVDPRRIIVDVEGTSGDGNEAYKSFLSAITSTAKDNGESLNMPLLLAETSQCTVSLDFAFDTLFSNVFVEFLKHRVESEASNTVAKASIRPVAATAEIIYDIVDKTLLDNKITMNPKQFTISPRQGAPSEARKYFISSPFDSDTHLKLVKELNKVITNSR